MKWLMVAGMILLGFLLCGVAFTLFGVVVMAIGG